VTVGSLVAATTVRVVAGGARVVCAVPEQAGGESRAASAMLCQWEWLALFVGGGGIELLEVPLS
jgi:hypothetical protein